jgi:hypothetical protein
MQERMPTPKLACKNEEVRDAESIVALIVGRNIYLTDSPLIFLFSDYAHEVGHMLGNKLSFLNGDVLRPDEVKTAHFQLTTADASILSAVARGGLEKRGAIRTVKPIIDKILTIYSKGEFKPSDVKTHYKVSVNRMGNLIRKSREAHGSTKGLLGWEITKDLNLIPLRTKEGMRGELSAYAVQVAVQTIIQNAINDLAPNQWYNAKIDNETLPGTFHDTALKIVKRAYAGTGWIIPSAKDLGII